MAIDDSRVKPEDREAIYKALGQSAPTKAEKPSKFRNVVTEADGLKFDSKKEARIWQELKAREAAGGITQLRRQVAYPLYVNGDHVADYVADFEFKERSEYDGWRTVTADVKGGKATRTAVYAL